VRLASRRWMLGIVLAAFVTLLCSVQPAVATTLDVLVDAEEITLEAGDEGALTGTVSLQNLTDGPIILGATIEQDAPCTITVDPGFLRPGQGRDVSLTLEPDCTVTEDAELTLWFDDRGKKTSFILPVKVAESDVDWSVLGISFLIGFAVSLVVLAATVARMDVKLNWLRERYPILAENQFFERNRYLEFDQPLNILKTDWSFGDNWASTVSLGSSVLVALLGTSEVLEALIGSKPEDSVMGLLTVVAALSGILVAIGPLFLKVIGPDTSVPTVLGVLVAAFVTLGGALAQIVALVWQGGVLTAGHMPAFAVVIVVGTLFGGVVLWYAVTELWRIILTGLTAAGDPLQPVPRSAWNQQAEFSAWQTSHAPVIRPSGKNALL
jgi:hypothetical protein